MGATTRTSQNRLLTWKRDSRFITREPISNVDNDKNWMTGTSYRVRWARWRGLNPGFSGNRHNCRQTLATIENSTHLFQWQAPKGKNTFIFQAVTLDTEPCQEPTLYMHTAGQACVLCHANQVTALRSPKKRKHAGAAPRVPVMPWMGDYGQLVVPASRHR